MKTSGLVHAHGGIDYRRVLCGTLLRVSQFGQGENLVKYVPADTHEPDAITCRVCRALVDALSQFWPVIKDAVDRVVAGEFKLAAVDETWDKTYAGNCVFALNNGPVAFWTIFNDCDSIDYSDSFEFRDGTRLEFGYFRDPLDLPFDRYARLEVLLKTAPVIEHGKEKA